MNIYSSSLRLSKIEPVVSVLPATIRQYFILALSLPLRWLRVIFVLNTLTALKEFTYNFQACDIAKRLRILPCDFIEIFLELRILESVICTFSKL